MKCLEKNGKKIFLIAAILLGVAVLAQVVPVLLRLWDVLEGLFNGYRFATILEGLVTVANLGLQGLVPIAFIVFAFVYMRTGSHYYLLAVASGVALAQMLLTTTLSLVSYFIGGVGSKYFMDNLLSNLLYGYLPSDLIPYLLFALIVVFSVKKKGCQVIPGAVLALLGGLLLNGVYGQCKSFLYYIYQIFEYGIEFEWVIKNLLSIFCELIYLITWYGGLILLVPAALQYKVSAQAEAEDLPTDVCVTEDDFASEAE